MKFYAEKMVKTLDSIYCDSCGKSCTKGTDSNPTMDHEYAEIIATWGYFSNQDGTQYDIQICETCFDEVIDFLKKKRKRILGQFKYPYDVDSLEGKSYIP